MGHLYIYACLKMQLCLKMQFSTAFGDTLKKRYSKIHEVWPRCNGKDWKMPFWIAPWLIYCVIFWRESDFFKRKLATILTPEVQIVWKISAFQCYWWCFFGDCFRTLLASAILKLFAVGLQIINKKKKQACFHDFKGMKIYFQVKFFVLCAKAFMQM